MPLVMAMKVNEPAEHRYLAQVVRPAMEGADVDLRTSVGHDEKADLMMRARAVLVPIGWDEPFGLVMAEAAACGAPVVAFRRGSASELVLDGISGRLVPPGDVDAMVAAVEGIGDIDPLDCRAWAEGRFSARRMVRRYLRVYDELVAHGSRLDTRTTNGAHVGNGERVGNGEVELADGVRTLRMRPATTSRLIRIPSESELA
jgi:glycosyltransferase involved in cell wall biosynthesis